MLRYSFDSLPFFVSSLCTFVEVPHMCVCLDVFMLFRHVYMKKRFSLWWWLFVPWFFLFHESAYFSLTFCLKRNKKKNQRKNTTTHVSCEEFCFLCWMVCTVYIVTVANEWAKGKPFLLGLLNSSWHRMHPHRQ